MLAIKCFRRISANRRRMPTGNPRRRSGKLVRSPASPGAALSREGSRAHAVTPPRAEQSGSSAKSAPRPRTTCRRPGPSAHRPEGHGREPSRLAQQEFRREASMFENMIISELHQPCRSRLASRLSPACSRLVSAGPRSWLRGSALKPPRSDLAPLDQVAKARSGSRREDDKKHGARRSRNAPPGPRPEPPTPDTGGGARGTRD